MENKINRFLKLIDININNTINNELVKDENIFPNYKIKSTFKFKLVAEETYPCYVTLLGGFPRDEALITLDEEDIEYFKNKYSKQLDLELEDKINKLKQEYGK